MTTNDKNYNSTKDSLNGSPVVENDSDGYDRDDYEGMEYDGNIKKPFDPSKVDIETKTYTLQNILNDIKDGFIDLNPDFQRHDDIWSEKQKSRLIESLILSIPLPSFYFDVLDDDKLEVVDGLQRLTAIKEYVNELKYSLKDLEYITNFNNKKFDEIDAKYKRKILNTNIFCYVIRKNTDENVKNSIFTRLNTGGEPLKPAEIKNALFRGKASEFIKDLAESEEFIKVTRGKIPTKRMLDREYVNRFFALYFIEKCNSDLDYDGVMIDALKNIKKSNDYEINNYRIDFLNGMKRAYELLNDIAFRKKTSAGYSKINRALYECTTVSLSKISESDFKRINKNKFNKSYDKLLANDVFISSISNSTFEKQNVTNRYKLFNNIIKESYD